MEKFISGSFVLWFQVNNDEVILSGFEEGGSRLFVPDNIVVEGRECQVTSIDKKTFFANGVLREISLPASVLSIGDWAFAQCANLRTVVFRGDNVQGLPSLGRGVFDKCHRIENICVGDEEVNDLSALLGAVIHRMPAEYLLKDGDLGRDIWYSKWDQCLSTFINEPDVDGYTDLVLCGEEDIFYNEPDFAENKRRRKAGLCLLRLLYDSFLADELRKKYVDYILQHNIGCKSEESWQVLLYEVDDNIDYYKLFARLGGINKDNIDNMIKQMGEEHAEPKAYLLKYKQDNFSGGNVFDMFEL